ncbi:unnamed protein product, partial [Prorocentrum cordatum]
MPTSAATDPGSGPPPGGAARGGARSAAETAASELVDYQELRLHDTEALGSAFEPRFATVALTQDLVGSVLPGDRAVVVGVVRSRWRPPVAGRQIEMQLVIEASSVRRLSSEELQRPPDAAAGFEGFWAAHRQDEFEGRQRLVEAAAPGISGAEAAKLALLLAVVGGAPAAPSTRGEGCPAACPADGARWERFLREGAPEEGWAATPGAGGRLSSHVLLMGDPSTGKTQLLEAARRLCPGAVRVSAAGASRAGLTCAVVRDGPVPALEPGALVLADGGLCCIDDLTLLEKEELAALHEAMEQQTISVASRGLVCQLRARCSVVAAQGWPARGAQVSSLPAPLLSRFDLVLALRAGAPGEQDDMVADAILDADGTSGGRGRRASRGAPLDEHSLRDVLASARAWQLAPAAEPQAEELLVRYYSLLRQRSERATCGEPTTARALEGLLRLSRAHAKLLRHPCVQVEDAVAAVFLHQLAARSRAAPGAEHVLSPELLGPGSPAHLRTLGLSADLGCRADYEAAEGAVLWALGMRRARRAAEAPPPRAAPTPPRE